MVMPDTSVMMGWLRNWLIEPLVRNLDPDEIDLILAHRDVLRHKPMLRRLFQGFYRECRAVDERQFSGVNGLRLEIGSGSSFFKEVYPDVWSSDSKPLLFVDFAARGEQLPVRDERVLAPLNPLLALQHTVVLCKKTG